MTRLREVRSELRTAPHGTAARLNTAHKRELTGSARAKARRAIWAEQQGKCAMCGALGNPAVQELDHIVPIHLGGGDERSNLQMLCRAPCHRDKTNREQGRTEKV